MHLQTQDVSLYTKLSNKLKNGRHYRDFEQERAGVQLQCFTVQKTAEEHSEQNKNEILDRAEWLDIPTVIITTGNMQFVGHQGVNISTEEILTTEQVEDITKTSENRWSSARWSVIQNIEGYDVLDFNCNYDMNLVLSKDAGFYVNHGTGFTRIKNRYDQINRLWGYGYPSKRGRPIRIGRTEHSGTKQEIEQLVQWVLRLQVTRTGSEVSEKVRSIYNTLNRSYSWPEHW